MFTIYKIIDVNYIGSTSNLKRRTLTHRSSCNNTNDNMKYNLLVYTYCRAKNIKIELQILGVYKTCSRRLRNLVEQYFINLYDSKNNGLNCHDAFSKYTDVNNYYRWYHQQNKERIHARKNQKINCSICGSTISKNNYAKHKKSKKCMMRATEINI